MTDAGLRKTTTNYDDDNRIVMVKRDLNTLNDGSIQTATHYDQLGRVSLVRQSDGSALGATSTTDGIKTKTIYRMESGGSCQIVSNPHRTGGEPSMGWTRTRKDQNGRPVETAFFSSEPSNCTTTTGRTGWTTTSYDATVDGRKVAVSEKASDGDKNRDSFLDALDRLTRVVEYPGTGSYLTTYGYDALDNLATVTQGAQNRQFTYDSLGRLTSAVNPESGTIGYTYFDDGLPKTKTDARGGTVSHTYDGLDRLVATTYSGGGTDFDSTPDTLRCYDGKLYNPSTHACVSGAGSLPGALQSLTLSGPTVGQLTAVGSAVSAAYFPAFNTLYQTTSSVQYTSSNRYNFAYSYNLADGLTSETYPSGREIEHQYDSAGRIMAATGTYESASRTYSQNYSYAPHGGVLSVQLNAGLLTETMQFNSRLQPTQIQVQPGNLLILDFGYGGTNNNGNILGQTIDAPGLPATLTQTYTYDGANRLKTADESGSWSQVYNYDAFGNRWVSANHTLSSATPTAQSQFDAATNRLTKTFDGTPLPADAYDDAGNLTKHAWVGAMAYDANNLQRYFCTSAAAACNAANADAEYQYDGDGRRVKKQQGTRTTVFVYDAFGNLAAEYDTQPAPNLAAGTYYRTTDHLGSTRLVTNATGGVVSRRDFFPFGEQIDDTWGNRQLVNDGNTFTTYNREFGVHQKFTAKERDTESGLDYFLARYYASSLGRFNSVDPIWVTKERMADPQRLNLYTYGRNNPLRYIDPTGMDVTLGRCEIGGVEDCFARVQQGLRKEDRQHVHLVQGNGSNGFKEGEYGIAVDEDHKSDSKNFQTLQKLAGDHSATAKIDVLRGESNFEIKTTVSFDTKTGKEVLATYSTTPNEGGGFGGYTFFPQDTEAPGPYSTGNFTNIIVNASRLFVPATIHHELRHVLLGDFGRVAPYGAHGTGQVDQETEEADKEAVRNHVDGLR